MPHFLYPIPKRVSFEILRQKLMLFVLLNPGRVLEALEREGFEAWAQPNPKGRSYGTVVARSEVVGPEGDRHFVELRNLDFYMREVICEFKSLEYLVDAARKMRKGRCGGAASIHEGLGRGPHRGRFVRDEVLV